MPETYLRYFKLLFPRINYKDEIENNILGIIQFQKMIIKTRNNEDIWYNLNLYWNIQISDLTKNI